MQKIVSAVVLIFLSCSCAVHQRANIKAKESFTIRTVSPTNRGGMIETALQGLFAGAKYLADQSAKSLVSSYSQTLSIPNYYQNYTGNVAKTYSAIVFEKHAKPLRISDKNRLTETLTEDLANLTKTRGASAALTLDKVVRKKEQDLMNFQAKIGLISDPENPSISRLSFEELRVFFSKTKIFSDENLNLRVSISIEGQWRDAHGTPHKQVLIEQQYDFKNLHYGIENQLSTPILSPWYYDIPMFTHVEGNENYGVVNISIQLEEYEGKKSKYLNKLPSILSENKNAIIKNGASTIQKIIDN